MMATGNVENGKGGKPYDVYMYFPPAFYVLGLMFALMNKSKQHWLGLIMQIILPIIGGFVAFYLRHKETCKDSFKDAFNKVLFNSIFTHGCAILATKGIMMVPVIGTLIDKITNIKYIGSFVDAGIYYSMYITIYVIINMMNGYNIDGYCNNTDSFLDLIRVSGTIAGAAGLAYGLWIDHSKFCSHKGNFCYKK
jgi:hypothetical protein